MATEDDLLQALEQTPGPDGTPLSRAVSGVNLAGAKAFVSLAGDPARPKEWEAARLAAQQAVERIAGIERAVVTLTAEHKPAPQAPRRPSLAALDRVRFIVAVASGKGGVGKSTTSVNLALGLAAQGWKVGLLDADIYGPSAPRLLGLAGKPEVAENKLAPMQAYGLKAMSIGLLVNENEAMIWRGPMATQALTQMLGEVLWGELDALIVDMPPGTGDVQLTMAQQVPLAGAVVVSTPQDLALIDARRAVSMFRKVEIPVLGIVENMSYFVCPHCGERSDIFAHGGARRDAEAMGVPFLGEVPLEAKIRETSDSGRPVVATDPQGPQAAAYLNLAAKVKTLLETQSRRAPPRIVAN